MQVTPSDFATLYLAARKLPPARHNAQLDEQLSPGYPLCLYRFADGRRLICLCPELEEALPALDALEEGAKFDRLWAFLFEGGPAYRKEEVTGFYLPDAPAPAADPRIRPLRRGDGPALHALGRLSAREWAAGRVRVYDPHCFGLFDQGGGLLAAAGAQTFGRLGDISVFVHPEHRSHGLGGLVVRALCSALYREGLTPLYRAENANKASCALARRLGFASGFAMTGAEALWNAQT